MSWSFEHTGTRDAVSKATEETLTKIASQYEGKAEADDVRVVMGRAITLINALDLVKDGYTEWNAVTVKGNGSHSQTATGIIAANFQLSVTRTSLKL